MATDYLATGDAHFSDDYVSNMQQVTAEQVRNMARKYLLPQKQLTAVLTPVPLPRAAGAADAAPDDTPARQITLDNGLRVLLKRRNPTVPLVNIQLYVMGGLLDETDQDNGLTSLMARLSTKGTDKNSAAEIAEYFDSIGGAVAAGCGNNTFFYAAEVMRDDFPQAFTVFTDIVLGPAFPQDELDKLRPQVLAAIAQQENSWMALGAKFFRREFFVASPYQRTSLGTTAAVGKIDRQQISDFHAAQLAANRTVLALVGDIDLTETEALVRRHFAPMPQGEPYDLTRFDPEPPISGPRRSQQHTPKNGAVIHLGFPGLRFTQIEDRYAMELIAQIVGSNTGWLHETLRGEGLVYYAWLANFMGLLNGYVAATAQCETDKAPQVIALMQDKLDQAARGEFSPDEFARAQNNAVNAEILDKQTNRAVAMTAALDELYGFGYDWSQGYADRIMALTLADLQRVAAKYLSGPATITIVTSAAPDTQPAPTPPGDSPAE